MVETYRKIKLFGILQAYVNYKDRLYALVPNPLLALAVLVSTLGVSPNFEIKMACGLKFHWYLRTFDFEISEG